MTVRMYKSTDASAPTLTGQNGALATVLDAILVNGYGSQTAAGWTIAFTATNKRMYTMAAGGTGCTLYLDDSSSVTTAKEARICGFLTATAMGTGTGQFPTGAQSTIGIGMLVARKSTTADATARAWTCIADGKTIYFFAETGDVTSPLGTYAWGFGDFFSVATTDTSNCMIMARVIENSALFATSATHYDPFFSLTTPNTTALTNVLVGCYCCANFTNVGGSLQFGKHSDVAKMGWDGNANTNNLMMGYLAEWHNGGGNGTWINEFAYPNPPDSGLYMAPVFIHHQGVVRGYLKGLWCPLQDRPLNHNDTFSGSGNLAGKDFICQSGVVTTDSGSNTIAGNARAFVEKSDTWT